MNLDYKIQKKTDIIYYILIMGITLVVNNFTNQSVKLLYYLIILFIFIQSKNSIIWLVIFFSVIMSIGEFFASTKYFFSSGPLKISLLPLFSIAALIKHHNISFNDHNIFKKPFKIYVIYLIFLLLYGFLILGNSGNGIYGTNYYAHTVIFIIVFPLFYTIQKMIKNYSDLLRLVNLIFISVLINLIGQIITIYFKKTFIDIVGVGRTIVDDRYGQHIVRPWSGVFHCYIAFIMGIYFYLKKEKYFSSNYLILVAATSLLSIVFSVTRGWIIAFGIVLITTVFIVGNIKYIRLVIIMMILSMISYLIVPTIKTQIDKVIRRFETIELILEGDLTGGGTVSRLTTRHDNVMRLFYKRPIIGSGFSKEAMDRNDMHVGNQNILMSGGIIGYGIILYFWLYFFYQIVKTRVKLTNANITEAKAISLLIPALLGLLTIHSSSTFLFAYINYVQGLEKLFFVAIIFAIFNRMLLETNKLIKKY